MTVCIIHLNVRNVLMRAILVDVMKVLSFANTDIVVMKLNRKVTIISHWWKVGKTVVMVLGGGIWDSETSYRLLIAVHVRLILTGNLDWLLVKNKMIIQIRLRILSQCLLLFTHQVRVILVSMSRIVVEREGRLLSHWSLMVSPRIASVWFFVCVESIVLPI